MRKTMTVAAFALVMSVLASGQALDKQPVATQTERELIALSREFVDTSVGREILVLEDTTGSLPKGAPVANVQGKWRSVDLEEIKISVSDNTAVVTGEVVFKGQTAAGRALDNKSALTIRFSRKKGVWKLVGGCLGKCD